MSGRSTTATGKQDQDDITARGWRWRWRWRRDREKSKGEDDPPCPTTPQSLTNLLYEPHTSFTKDSVPSIDAYIGSKAGRRECKAEKKVVVKMVTKMDAGHVLQ